MLQEALTLVLIAFYLFTGILFLVSLVAKVHDELIYQFAQVNQREYERVNSFIISVQEALELNQLTPEYV